MGGHGGSVGDYYAYTGAGCDAFYAFASAKLTGTEGCSSTVYMARGDVPGGSDKDCHAGGEIADENYDYYGGGGGASASGNGGDGGFVKRTPGASNQDLANPDKDRALYSGYLFHPFAGGGGGGAYF